MRRIILALSLALMAGSAFAQPFSPQAGSYYAPGAPFQSAAQGVEQVGIDSNTNARCMVGETPTCQVPTSGGGGGGGGTSSPFGAAFPTTGTAAGFIDSSTGHMVGGNINTASGGLEVDVVAGSSGNAAASATGSAVPLDAGYTGLSNAGTLIGWIGDSVGRGIVAGAGVAGTPAGGVASVQGVSGGTNLNVNLAASSATNISTNEAQINGVTPLMGNGVTGTGSQRVTIASDNTAFTVNAAQATAANLNATVVGTGTFAVQNAPTASATGGATPASVLSANSTNATVLKASAGTLYHTSLQSSSTTALAYIIYFNTTTTPTCTATPYYGPFLIPYVGSTGNGGSGIVDESGVGASFTTGISYCITTAPGGTGSVAANAVSGGILYK